MPLGVLVFGRAIANRCKRGLYGRRQVQFGNRVSEDGGNRTRRKWNPNASKKRLYSEQLRTFIRLQVTAGALRNIDKAGGLDRYVRKIEGSREDSLGAERIRAQLDRPKLLQQLQQAKVEDLRLKEERKREKADRARLSRAQKGKTSNRRKYITTVERPKSDWEKEDRKDSSTVGWLRRNVLSGFKWK